MGLTLAIRRAYHLQAFNLLRLAKWLFWGAVFFCGGLSIGLYHNADAVLADKIKNATLILYACLALFGFLLRLWEWRLNRPSSLE
jgi:hypothetical protein